jgi:hypothetical protein
MKPATLRLIPPALLLAATFTLSILSTPLPAAQPDWADKGGKGKGSQDRDRDSRDDRPPPRQERGNAPQAQPRSGGLSIDVYFDDRRRAVVRDYFGEQVRSGKCPPGLAKKHNGCMPPGQAKQWTVGRPLPRDIVYYDLPPSLVVRLGTPPSGHKYVRVAADILLIAIGTSMVIDAIQDLGSL